MDGRGGIDGKYEAPVTRSHIKGERMRTQAKQDSCLATIGLPLDDRLFSPSFSSEASVSHPQSTIALFIRTDSRAIRVGRSDSRLARSSVYCMVWSCWAVPLIEETRAVTTATRRAGIFTRNIPRCVYCYGDTEKRTKERHGERVLLAATKDEPRTAYYEPGDGQAEKQARDGETPQP